MGLISYLLKLFKFKPGWNGTPEIFLAMVLEMQSQNNPEYAVHEVLQWGEVMQKVIKVNFKPFKDFPDLLQNGVPDFSMVEKLRGKLAEVKQRTTLKKAIYGEHADLGDDDVMKVIQQALFSPGIWLRIYPTTYNFPRMISTSLISSKGTNSVSRIAIHSHF